VTCHGGPTRYPVVVLTSWDRYWSDCELRPTRYRAVVLTSWDRDKGGCDLRPTRYCPERYYRLELEGRPGG